MNTAKPSPDKINIAKKLNLFDDSWSPKIIAELNDNFVKVAKLEGNFIWHRHKDEDELFLVIEGTLTMHFRDREVKLKPGELIVIPKGVEHKPEAAEGVVSVLLVEPQSVLNTGDQKKSEYTREELDWI
jgi:mannose-6-phosphate isomerase-like protein (cupin superfamily)